MAANDWDLEVAELARQFERARHEDVSDLLRGLHATLCDAPPEVAASLGEPCDRAAFTKMLGETTLHNLAFALVGRAGMQISQSTSGRSIATVVAHGLFEESTFDGNSMPLAIGGALVGGLANWASASFCVPASRATH